MTSDPGMSGSIIPTHPVPKPGGHPAGGKPGDYLSSEQVVNTRPWQRQENAAWSRMASQLLAALEVYEQQTADAGHLLTAAQSLAAGVRHQLEAAAWSAFSAHMRTAADEARQVITPDLPNRERDLTAAYNRVMLSLAQAVSEWQRWMNAAQAADDQIISPVQAAYDKRLDYAYQRATDIVSTATEDWKRMFYGAQAIGTRLSEKTPPAGLPGPVT